MAEESKTPPAGDSNKPWWQELLSALPRWAYWFTGIGLVGALLLAAYGTKNGRRLVEVMTGKVGPMLWKMTEDQFRRLEFIVYLLANTVFIIDGFILLEFGRRSLHFLWWDWPSALINRVVGGMPVMLLLQVLLFFPLVRMAKWLIAFGVAEGWLRRDGLDEKIVTRFVRAVAKLNAWHAAGFALAALPPYHKWPELLAISAALVPVWPYFCNAWKAGDSEHLRRILLAVMGWATIDMALLATLHPLVKAPFLAFFTGQQFTWIGPATFALFVLQGAGAWVSGGRKTAADRAWEAEEVEGIHLRRLAKRQRYLRKGLIDAGLINQSAPIGTPEPPKPRSSRSVVHDTWYPQPQSHAARNTIAVALIIIAASFFIGVGHHQDWWYKFWAGNW